MLTLTSQTLVAMLVVVSARGTPAKAPPGELGGTSWRIVNFEGGDGKNDYAVG